MRLVDLPVRYLSNKASTTLKHFLTTPFSDEARYQLGLGGLKSPASGKPSTMR